MSSVTVMALDADNFTADQARRSLQQLAQVPVGPALEALDDLVENVVAPTAEQILGALAPIFPQAKLVEIAIEALVFVAHGYRTGAIKSADPQAPEMLRAVGADNPQMGG